MSNNSVELVSFSKFYGKKTACENINFTAREKSITGILGPNGAGKSTLLKAIGGECYPTLGLVSVCNKTNPDEIRFVTGYVPELPSLEPGMTVKDVLCLQADLYKLTESEQKKAVQYAVDFCGLDEVLSKKCRTLSKGFKQRVSLAKALCSNPKVLILDEFSAGLDPLQIAEMRKKIKEYSGNATVIFSTHHIEEAEYLCDYIYIIADGKICAHGTKKDLIEFTKTNCLEDAYRVALENLSEVK